MAVRVVREPVDEARSGCDGAGGGAEEEVEEVGGGGCPGGGGVEEGWVEGEFGGHFVDYSGLYVFVKCKLMISVCFGKVKSMRCDAI